MVIDLKNTEDTRDVVHRAVQALTEGKLVVFPLETVYTAAASALHEGAVARLVELTGSGDGNQLADRPLFPLAVKSYAEALDYVPQMSALGQRLARRCWPGPITMVFPGGQPESLLRQLPLSVQRVVSPEQQLGLRVPGHQMLLEVLKLVVGPLVLGTAHSAPHPEPTTAQEVAQGLGDSTIMILDDGRCRFSQSASVLAVQDHQFEVLRPGVVSDQNLRRLASQIIVFVCTGNTCRSPMAEMICRKLLAERLNCPLDQLEEHGIIVLSAGISAMMGSRASPEGVQVLKDQYGLDLSNHVSQPLSEQMIRQADHLLVMTRGHRHVILTEYPDAADRTRLLCRDESDVSDPIGGPLEFYQRCAQQIETALREWISEFVPLPGH